MFPKSPAPDTTSQPEPSESLKANRYLMECLRLGLSIQECERQAEGTERLKEAFSCSPFYAKRAAEDPDYWNKLYGSRVNW
ncbi:hypothetical protein SAMN05421538_102176 [Paracoccus isoporae]|uniref:Uncharacterized protein n=1 Tax=Paracoccus isoporae TaxID=591205 RepID=A0A1G6WN31_9RHOB|nr:hypothetical protein SAMN05421538_102176 [Paracoccus isoporae]